MVHLNGAFTVELSQVDDLNGTESEDDTPSWDPTDETWQDFDEPVSNEDTCSSFIKLVKLVVYLATFCLVLGCAVISKSSLLLMTAVINKKRTFPICQNYSGLEVDHHYEIRMSSEERYNWVWCILIVLLVPEILTFARCSRICVFKSFHKPNISSFVMVLVIETIHVVGIVTMIFLVLPYFYGIRALSMMNAVCIAPAFINLFTNCGKVHTMKTITNILAVIAQCSVIVPAFINYNSPEVWAVFSVTLISFAWWENFISPNSYRPLVKLKENIQNSRPFIYIFISIWKVIVIFSLILLYLYLSFEDVYKFLTNIANNFRAHDITVEWPINEDFVVPDLIKPPGRKILPNMKSNPYLPMYIALLHLTTSFLCYASTKFACKVCIQGFSYALPVCMTVPVAMTLLTNACDIRLQSGCAFSNISPYIFWSCRKDEASYFFYEDMGFMWIPWFLSQIWITYYIWFPKCERMASSSKLFVIPMYCTVLIDQSLALNRRKHEEDFEQGMKEHKIENDVTRIFACATMWHETPDEMEQLLKSIMRMDVHQCSLKTIQKGLTVRHPDYYELETHIFFDDAFTISDDDHEFVTINNFVKDLTEAVNTAASKVYKNCAKIEPPFKVPTPYGGRLIWHLGGDNFLVVHLKNKELIRHKKRWSQVMYMYYLLRWRLPQLQGSANSTFILALDGDIDFRPDAVQLLVDLMRRNKTLGAACGRIHPVGTGLMVYYQKFEYAIGHWLQKATEHMIGCVLCSPGCFSLFRAEALMQKNTIQTYATIAKEAIEYVQFDQGEDRWLCTLLLQRGFRVEYSAASDAYTHCPETFGEFYTQRRRWAPSTMANIMDLLIHYQKTVDINDNISRPYIGYQVLLMVGTILGPGTIFLMLVGAMVSAFGISNWQSFASNLIPIIVFILICFYAKNNIQILVAEVMSALYALLMMAVLVGISLQVALDGVTSPSAIFILSMTASFIFAALIHPREFGCVLHGLIYFMSVPSMYLLLALYSFVNLHVVSWGTREVQQKKSRKQLQAEAAQAPQGNPQKGDGKGVLNWLQGSASEEEGGVSFGLGNLFKCMLCTYPKPDTDAVHRLKVENKLDKLHEDINKLQKNFVGMRRRSSLHALDTVQENDELDDVENDDENVSVDEHTYSIPDDKPEHWLTHPALVMSPIKRLMPDEQNFWNQLIQKYLYPLNDNPEEKAKVSRQLIELRNKVVFGVLMLNSLFILIVFLLQMQKATLHVEWRLNGQANITYLLPPLNEVRIEMTYLHLEPINLVLVFFFTLILVVQFIAMLFHRFETLSHILASTTLMGVPNKNTEVAIFSQLSNLLQKQGLQDDVEVFARDDEDIMNINLPTRSLLIQSQCPRPVDTVSLGSARKPQHRSLSIAMEQNLHRILHRDKKFAQSVRRMSQDPSALTALRRRFSLSSRSTTPYSGSVRTTRPSSLRSTRPSSADAHRPGSFRSTPRVPRRTFEHDNGQCSVSVRSFQLESFATHSELETTRGNINEVDDTEL